MRWKFKSRHAWPWAVFLLLASAAKTRADANYSWTTNDDDTITVFVGVQTNGQGHETAFTQIMSARLGVDADRIRIVQGDSDFTPEGMTGGSRSIPVAGAAVLGVSDNIISSQELFKHESWIDNDSRERDRWLGLGFHPHCHKLEPFRMELRQASLGELP